MDRVAEYKKLVRQAMDEYADYMPEREGFEMERIYDDEKGHYELLYFGFEGYHRTHGIVMRVLLPGIASTPRRGAACRSTCEAACPEPAA